MINKTELRESVAEVLESGQYSLKYVPEEILNSKEFIQKIYRKDYKLFHWIPLYLSDKTIWLEVKAEQEKIKLGNAFNNFCKISKLIKPNHKIDLDNMTNREADYFKAFKPLYNQTQIALENLHVISDYATYEIVSNLSNEYNFNLGEYSAMKSSRIFHETLEKIAIKTIEKIEEQHG